MQLKIIAKQKFLWYNIKNRVFGYNNEQKRGEFFNELKRQSARKYEFKKQYNHNEKSKKTSKTE